MLDGKFILSTYTGFLSGQFVESLNKCYGHTVNGHVPFYKRIFFSKFAAFPNLEIFLIITVMTNLYNQLLPQFLCSRF